MVTILPAVMMENSSFLFLTKSKEEFQLVAAICMRKKKDLEGILGFAFEGIGLMICDRGMSLGLPGVSQLQALTQSLLNYELREYDNNILYCSFST